MAACIVLVVSVQQISMVSPHQYIRFEAGKFVLATALWLWLVLDFQSVPWLDSCRNYYKDHPYQHPCYASQRVMRAAVAGIVLLQVLEMSERVSANGGQCVLSSNRCYLVLCVEVGVRNGRGCGSRECRTRRSN